MHRNHRLLMNWKSGILLCCIAVMAVGAGPKNQSRQVNTQSVTPIQLDIDWSAADGVKAISAMQLDTPSPALIAAETAQHEIGIAKKNNRISVLVHFSPVIARGMANPRVAVRAYTANSGGVVKHEYGSVLPNVINLRDVPESSIAALEKMPGVTRVELDEYHPNLINLHDGIPLVNGLQSQITGAGISADGAGIRVCICDTGIDIDHVMYTDRIDSAAGYDFYNNDSNPDDDNGHGSHVAGIAVGGVGLSVDFGCGAGSQEFQGMAPAATLIGAKILNSGGGGFDSDIIAGIDHCADQSPSGGRADVINLSIGTGDFSSGACTHSWAVAANNAVANGVVVVAASGNENNSNSMGSPACGASVIAVGMTWKNNYPTCEDSTTNWNWGICTDFGPQTDEVGCFSNESDFLDVSAPGANIWSASNAAGGGSITGKSGTSMASPMVAGLAALILSVDPALTPAEVRQIIRDGAIDLGPAGFDRGYGWGRIDVVATLSLISTGCTVPADCDDGNVCNGTEDCVADVCQSGTPLNCDNGVFCDGVETCDSGSGCQSGSDPCPGQLCDESADACVDCFNNADCDDGAFCNGAETCSGGACQAGGDPCPGQGCDEGTSSCVPLACNNNGTCDSGEDCNNCSSDCISGSGASCGNGVCESGDGEDCVNCAADCNGRTGGRPSNRFCCGAGGGTNPLPCSDSTCSSGGWSCTDTPAVGSCCGDGTCDGAENDSNCAIDCACQSAADCNDGVACTDDACVGGFCQNTANDANCSDDGSFCNGSEYCDGSSCSSTGDPCNSGETCNEATDTCDVSTCGSRGDSCSSGADCCSGRCKNNGTCR